MPADAVAGPPRTQISSDWLLLVEGKDEVNLFNALMRHRFDAEPQIQVIDAGGVNKFPRSLNAIRTAAQTRPRLRAIGVVRDADNDAADAFASVCGQIRDAGYEPPAGHSEFSNDVPSIGVFIVPDGNEPGAIETLCRRSKEGEEASQVRGGVPELPGRAWRHEIHQRRQELRPCLPRRHGRPCGTSGRRCQTRGMGFRIPGVRGVVGIPSRTRFPRTVNASLASSMRIR